MKIVINDANILIDLAELGMLSDFFQLTFEFRTTNLILDELFDEQYAELIPFIESGNIIVDEISIDELAEIVAIRAKKPTLSEQDCSAFHQARKYNASLITSDNSLRKFARQQGVVVHGHLWVFDCLVASNIFSGTKATQKLSELTQKINPRLGLPEHECQMRFNIWSRNQKNK
jgi:predicted nucleic acid-binding protein